MGVIVKPIHSIYNVLVKRLCFATQVLEQLSRQDCIVQLLLH